MGRVTPVSTQGAAAARLLSRDRCNRWRRSPRRFEWITLPFSIGRENWQKPLVIVGINTEKVAVITETFESRIPPVKKNCFVHYQRALTESKCEECAFILE